MSWLYKTEKISHLDHFPENTFGFVYKVTHIPSGKIYIGRKNLFHYRKQKLGKKELEAYEGKGRKPKYKQTVKESDWLNYYGSNKAIQLIIKEGKIDEFERRILIFAPNKKLLTYYETKYLFKYEVLEHPQLFLNDNILGKFYTKDLENQ